MSIKVVLLSESSEVLEYRHGIIATHLECPVVDSAEFVCSEAALERTVGEFSELFRSEVLYHTLLLHLSCWTDAEHHILVRSLSPLARSWSVFGL